MIFSENVPFYPSYFLNEVTEYSDLVTMIRCITLASTPQETLSLNFPNYPTISALGLKPVA